MTRSPVEVEVENEYDLFCRGTLGDPYPLMRRLREADPVHWCEPLGTWILTRYADVAGGLRDRRMSCERASFFMSRLPSELREPMAPLGEHIAGWMNMTDPPRHRRLRGLFSKAFTPRMIEGLRPRVVEIVDELLAALRGRREVELMREFAYPLPARVICEMLGIPESDRDRFRGWAQNIVAFSAGSTLTYPQVAGKALAGIDCAGRYFDGLMDERRRNPQSDIISALVSMEGDDALSGEELVPLFVLLFIAGHETTMNLLANGTLTLLRNPEELARLRADPGLLPTAIEEFLRYESPLQRVTRLAAEDFDLDGRRIERGQGLILLVGAANRDPAQFTDPERLDVGRRENDHMAFGTGIHFCLGAPLARMEAAVAFPRLLDVLETRRLTHRPIEWRQNMGLRGPAELWLSA
jgi:cytochrome P450